MTKKQVKEAVIGALKRLSTGNNEYDTYGMDVNILRRHALGEDITFVVQAVQTKIHGQKGMPRNEAFAG